MNRVGFCLAFFIVGCILFMTLGDSSKIPMPPSRDYVECGCKVERHGNAETFQGWATRVWVEYKDGKKWTRLYSIRGPSQRRKALLDCDHWLSELAKSRRDTEKPEKGSKER